MIFGNTKVVFSAGCEIKEVTTALESFRVLISGLPASTTKEDLEDFLTSAGFDHFHIPVLRTSGDRETEEASVIFDGSQHAEAAVQVLNKQKYLGKVLKFELAPMVASGQMDYWSYNRSSYLEVTFDAPSKHVQAVYPTIEAALAKAKALDGRYCGGRTVHATVARGPKQEEAWTYIKNSVIISNVAINTPDSEIYRFSKAISLKTFGLRKFRVDGVLRELEDYMKTVGGIKPHDFNLVQNHREGTVFVRCRFDTWERADKIYRSLLETELEFLAPTKTRFFLAFPHQYSLYIPLEQYDAQKGIYDALKGQHGRDRSAHIVATRYRTVCLIQVVGVDRKAVGALKLKVEKIARGEVVEVWNRFFLDWQGDAFFGRLQRQFGAYVRPDKIRLVLKVYGSDSAVNHARREIGGKMENLAGLDYQMVIDDRRTIGFFTGQGMKILGDMFGEDNVWLHTTSEPFFISVRGGHDAEHALQTLVNEALKKPPHPPILGKWQTCPLCLEELTQPFTLACRHTYCALCLTRMLTSATDGESTPLRCTGDEGRCGTPIPLPVIERFVPPARLERMLENSFRVYLERHPEELRFCPTTDCTHIYRVSKEPAVVRCPACLAETCSRCYELPHRGPSCDGIKLTKQGAARRPAPLEE